MRKVTWLLGASGVAIVALAFASVASAGSFTEDTGIVCGSGANTFDVINTATVQKSGREFFDQNGNFVKDIIDIDTVGTFSNSVTGASLAYKARSVEHDSLTIPGDLNSTFTAVTTGEMQITAPGRGVVWQNDGRFVDTFDPNGNETLAWQGPHDDLVYGFLGDTSVAQKLCSALGA